MTSKELNRIYESEKAKYKAEIQNDNGSYICKGCGYVLPEIEIHHIIKRSQSKYYYADKRNFMALCHECHQKAEGTFKEQNTLYCFEYMMYIQGVLLTEYYSLKPYEQTLLFKYGK